MAKHRVKITSGFIINLFVLVVCLAVISLVLIAVWMP
jgi:hypothetical protein